MRAPSADEFLLEFHAANPGLTSREFARGRCADGRSSYQVLADLAGPEDRVLDLGCGDGYLLELLRGRGLDASQLVGVDMSEAELQMAAERAALAGVDLRCERAQALSVNDGSVSLVVSHLAFMLMSDLPEVIAELARVLQPGGRFATIVGGGPGESESFELFLSLFSELYDDCERKAPRIGDKRARHEDVLAELCTAEAGFESVTGVSHPLHLDGPIDAVWSVLSSIYELHVVDQVLIDALRERFYAAVGARWGADSVPCVMNLRLIEARTHASR